MAIRVGIIACEALKSEIELLSADDADIVYREYVKFGMHDYPKKLKGALIEKVNSLEGKVDSVFLGYGYCQSLEGIIKELRIPTVIMEAEDCISILMTPPVREEECRKCAGTFFATPFFSQNFVELMTMDLHLEKLKDKKYDEMWFIKKFFEGYSRCMYVDTGIGNREKHEDSAKGIAKLLNLQYESRDGTLMIVSESIKRAKALASRAK
jgi:hypothetical protein